MAGKSQRGGKRTATKKPQKAAVGVHRDKAEKRADQGRSSSSGSRYGKKAGEKVERAMHEMKEGKLKSGRSGKKVTSREQAIAIGLSEARQSGGKVPDSKVSTGRPRRKGASRKGK